MRIEGGLKYKKLSECIAGELVRFKPPYALAIVIEQQGSYSRLGFLQPRCFLARYEAHTTCLSYGNDWFLVLEPSDETYPKNSSYTEVSGTVHVDSNGMLMTFDPPREAMSMPIAVRLPSMEVVETPGYESAPILKWTLWASEAARDRNEKLLCEFAYSSD